MHFSYYTYPSQKITHMIWNYSRNDWDTICTWKSTNSHWWRRQLMSGLEVPLFHSAISSHTNQNVKTSNTSEEEPFTHSYCLQTCWNSFLNVNWPSPNSKVQNQKGYGQSTRYSRIWIQKCSRAKNCIRNGQLGSLFRPGHLHLCQCSCMYIVSTTWSHLPRPIHMCMGVSSSAA